jgi:hypothetical protein
VLTHVVELVHELSMSPAHPTTPAR